MVPGRVEPSGTNRSPAGLRSVGVDEGVTGTVGDGGRVGSRVAVAEGVPIGVVVGDMPGDSLGDGKGVGLGVGPGVWLDIGLGVTEPVVGLRDGVADDVPGPGVGVGVVEPRVAVRVGVGRVAVTLGVVVAARTVAARDVPPAARAVAAALSVFCTGKARRARGR